MCKSIRIHKLVSLGTFRATKKKTQNHISILAPITRRLTDLEHNSARGSPQIFGLCYVSIKKRKSVLQVCVLK